MWVISLLFSLKNTGSTVKEIFCLLVADKEVGGELGPEHTEIPAAAQDPLRGLGEQQTKVNSIVNKMSQLCGEPSFPGLWQTKGTGTTTCSQSGIASARNPAFGE